MPGFRVFLRTSVLIKTEVRIVNHRNCCKVSVRLLLSLDLVNSAGPRSDCLVLDHSISSAMYRSNSTKMAMTVVVIQYKIRAICCIFEQCAVLEKGERRKKLSGRKIPMDLPQGRSSSRWGQRDNSLYFCIPADLELLADGRWNLFYSER